MAFLTEAANRGSIGGYDIDNSLKLEADNSEYMKRVMTATGNRKTFTISVWLKRTELQAGAGSVYGHTFFLGGNGGTGTAVHLTFKTGTPNSDALLFKINTGTFNVTNRVFRDTSAWYHIVLAVDTTQATASDRLKLYVNGVQETSFATINYPTQNSDTQNNFFQSATYGQEIGAYDSAGTYYGKFCGYLAEYNHIDGQALAPTDFGEFDSGSGIWKPKAYEGTYGTNGWYLDFVDAANLGDDVSGNGNNFTLTNITAADQATDTPTNNFCIMNMLNRTNGNIKNQEGGTKVTTDGGSGWCSMLATMGVTKGKWYWESQRMSTGTPNDIITGIVGSEDAYIPFNTAANYYIGNVATSSSIGYYQKNYPSQEGSVINGVGLNFFSAPGDTIMFGLDMDNNKMYFGLNGTWLATNGTDSIGGNPARASTLHADFDGEFVLPAVSVFQGNNMTINFGGYAAYTISSAASDANGYGTFEYAPPSGYYALCSKNLAEFGG